MRCQYRTLHPAWTMRSMFAARARGCATVVPTNMEVPPEVAGVQPQPVQGRNGSNHPLSFGRWIVAVPATFFAEGYSVGRDAPLAEPVIVTLRHQGAARQARDEVPFRAGLAGSDSAKRVLDRRLRARSSATSITSGSNWEEFRRDRGDAAGLSDPRLPVHGTAARPDGPACRLHHVARFRHRAYQWRKLGCALDQPRRKRARISRAQPIRLRAAAELARSSPRWKLFGDGRVWMQPGLAPQEEDAQAVVMTALLYYAEMLTLQDDRAQS